MNIILAERTKESTKTDTCNGLGKSTLIEILHFLLGSSTKSAKGILVPELEDSIFTTEMTFGHRVIEISRSIKRPTRISISGDIPDGFSKGTIGIEDFTEMLGQLSFGLIPDDEQSPSFRSLISYFIRRGIGAYLNPFEYFAKMKAYPRQLNNSYLLGLDWKIASAFEALGARAGVINQMRREAKAGTLFGIERKLSELEVAKVRLEREIKQQASQLKDFKVHPQYREIEEESSRLTSEIHDASNQNFHDRRILDLYQATLNEEHEASPVLVEQMYKEAGLIFTDQIKKELSDVLEFHKQVAKNRKTYVAQEQERLTRNIRDREALILKLDAKRSERLQILQTHRALDEYTVLQKRHLEMIGQLDTLSRQIEMLRKIEMGKASIDVDKAVLSKRAMTSLEEHSEQREDAIVAFDNYVRQLYDRPGSLIIRVGKEGYEFNTKIDRMGSTGIDFMTVFCYDFTLSQLWRNRDSFPGLLVHDSIIYDGVDARQKARALELAAKESSDFGFQYICTFNADELPVSDFSPEFDFSKYITHRLTDKDVSGSLLGLRIESRVEKSEDFESA
ncbi:MAG: DUF2326 domain-containing protein [Cyanobacteria bacterium REEB67]|nr:DUF2326 domain-containing protein [Cyanobacteria bacterium REEB67]